jgi:CheY-like chemotaxis protein
MAKASGRRILVVDDEPFVCESIKMLLAHDGHEVETASGGEEALSKYEPSRFDVVFTDFAMPGMKGDQLAAKIKSQTPVRPVVLLTAFPPPTVPPAIDLVVTKPFMLQTLREALRKVLDGTEAKD